jgi:tRNA A37 threonylcarbamoyladenosine biosynthesis protein TsaE
VCNICAVSLMINKLRILSFGIRIKLSLFTLVKEYQNVNLVICHMDVR